MPLFHRLKLSACHMEYQVTICKDRSEEACHLTDKPNGPVHQDTGSACLPACGEGRSAALVSGLCWPPSHGAAPAGQPAAAPHAPVEPSPPEHAAAEPGVPQPPDLEGWSAHTHAHHTCPDRTALLNNSPPYTCPCTGKCRMLHKWQTLR